MTSQMLHQFSNRSCETELAGIHSQWVCFQEYRDLSRTAMLIGNNKPKKEKKNF